MPRSLQPVDLDLLKKKLVLIHEELKDEYLQTDSRAWVIGFSGGKDSTLVLQMVSDMLFDLPPSKRTRPIHIVANDTLVESPEVIKYLKKSLIQIQNAVSGLHLPMKVSLTMPEIDTTFWVNLIGRGYPAPSRSFRWCTDRMKIRPTSKYIKERISESGEVVLLLGVRRSESSQRAKSAKQYDHSGRLNPHNELRGCLVFRPILELSTEEVWQTLLQSRPFWAESHRELITLYKNAMDGDCPLILDKDDAPSCGTSSPRFGCWTCTVVSKDKSIQGYIDHGFEYLEPLANFRDELMAISMDRGNRMNIRRNGEDGVGPIKIEVRQQILEKLLSIQNDSKLDLIANSEIKRIHEIWQEDRVAPWIRLAKKMEVYSNES